MGMSGSAVVIISVGIELFHVHLSAGFHFSLGLKL